MKRRGPEQSGSKKRRVNRQLRQSYDANFKMMVVNAAETSNNCQAAMKYGVSECNVRRWRVQKDNLRNANSKRKAFRGPQSGRFQEIDRGVCEFVTEKRNEGMPITRAIIQRKALDIAKELNIPTTEFKASIGWCRRMMRRSGLALRRTTSLESDSDSEHSEGEDGNIQHLVKMKEELPPKQDENWSPRPNQEDQKSPRIKEEQQEADISRSEFTFSCDPVKNEDEEKLQPSELLHNKTKEMKDFVEGPEVEKCLGSDKTSELSGRDVSDGDWEESSELQSDTISVKNNQVTVDDTRDESDVQQLLVIKEELSPEEYNQEPRLQIKEELEETDIKTFIFNPDTVKMEDDEEEPQSSELHHNQTEENRDSVEPDPEDSSDCSQTDVSDGNWEESDEPSSGLTSERNNKASVGDTRSKSGNKIFICTECEKTFNCKSHLLQHNRIHSGEKPFSCSACSAAFAWKHALVRHMRTHTEEKPYSCSVCEKNFSCKSSLTYHTRTHTGEKPFSCSVCSAAFKCKQNFIRHTRTHTGEKPFSCPICSKNFSHKSSLTYHTRIHTGEKPFSCSVCSATFKCRRNFVRHTRTHTGEKPFSCPVCSKTFSHKSSLTYHIRTHTGEKPFSCSVCSAAFKCRRNFVRHTKTHTGEKPFSCPVCAKSFRMKQNLVTHTRIHRDK